MTRRFKIYFDISPPTILGILLVPLPFLVVALLKEGSMGGGDIKLVGACSFFLGFSNGLLGSSVGLAFGILVNMLYFWYMKLDYTGKIALVPYLGIGYVCMSFTFLYLTN